MATDVVGSQAKAENPYIGPRPFGSGAEDRKCSSAGTASCPSWSTC